MTPRLWSAGTVLAVVGLAVAALAVGTSAWFTAATRAAPERQIGAANLAVLAAVLLGAAATVWLALGRGAVTRRSRQLVLRALEMCSQADDRAAAGSSPADDSVVTSATMTLYHRRGCPLTHGRDVRPVSGPARKKRLPCGVCKP